MGFQRKPYKLVWPEDSQWHGLEVSLRGMSLANLEEIAMVNVDTSKQSNIDKLSPLLDILQNAIISWNYEDEDGNLIPISDFRQQDAALLLAIIQGWQGVVGNVPTPLPPSSFNGKPFQEVQIPMEIPSSNLQNLNGQN